MRIDVCVGGYEHRIDRPHVEAGLIALCTHERCIAVCAQLPCGPWSVSKHGAYDGPRPIFDVNHPDGVTDASGGVHVDAVAALTVASAGARILSAALCTKRVLVFSEHPVSHGRGSLVPYTGCELHSTMHETTLFRKLIKEHGLVSVITDLAMSGHSHQKTTDFLCNGLLAFHMRSELGTLSVPAGWKTAAAPLRGKDESGANRTRAEQVYSSQLCYRLSLCILRGRAAQVKADVEGGHEDSDSQDTTSATIKQPLDTLEIGDPIEVYWTEEKRWYPQAK